MRAVAVPLALLAAGCGGERSFGPGRSVRLQFEVAGLPDGGSAEYRVFVGDTVAVAHGMVANGETDTVRISSTAALRVRWQDALVPVGQADYVFAPGRREVLIEEADRDTTVSVAGAYTLGSGGFILTAPGIPAHGSASWGVWSEDVNLVASGPLRSGEVVRRGDLPPGSMRLQLDTALVELDGVFHAYTPPELNVPLSISASLDLIPIDATYALASAVVRMSVSGLPAGTYAPWGLNTLAGDYGVGGSVLTDTTQTVDRVRPASYNVEWGEVTIDGVTYRPDPAIQPATLDPRIEPYEFAALYAAVP
jgi:hypothetical protein